MGYQEINSRTIDKWIEEGWEWGIPVSHEEFEKAKRGEWDVFLTPTKPMPHEWVGDLKEKRLLGLASGGGQQMPIFSALGAQCTVLDYSEKQVTSDIMVAEREQYQIKAIRGDMTKPLPFDDESFDIIFHPVSDCYIEEVTPLFKECVRVLKKGGILVCGFDNGINFLMDEDESKIVNHMPFNPLKNPDQMKQLEQQDGGVQFSHSLEELIGGQLQAGLTLTDLYEDTNGMGYLHELNIFTFLATRAVKR